jgi:hypothetical protein
VNHVELLDRLFAARRELVRLGAATASVTVPEDVLTGLLERRDQLNVQIQSMIAADLGAAMAEIDDACKAIDDATAELRRLGATAADLTKAIAITKKVLDVAGGLLATL